MLRLTQVYFVHCTISSYGKEWEYMSESTRERMRERERERERERCQNEIQREYVIVLRT